MGSFLSARGRGGRWLLRIDDLDSERCVPGLADQFQSTLAEFGFEWDGDATYQSDRIDAYAEALAALRAAGRCYPWPMQPIKHRRITAR